MPKFARKAERVDVVIVNYNAGSLLVECIESLLVQDCNIIIVDNASIDSSLALCEQKYAENRRIKIFKNSRNYGFAAACNKGYKETQASKVLFINPDCSVHEKAISELRKALDSEPDIGMVGGLLLNPDGSEQRGGRRAVPTPWRSFVRASGLYLLQSRWPRLFFDFYLHKLPLPDSPIEVESISGACMMVKREAVKNVGLWDAGYFLHCEDLDWCMRFRQKGWNILFVPSAKITHDLGACSRSRPLFVQWHKHKGMCRFYRKFFKHQYPLGLMGLVNFGVWLRFTLIAVSWLVSGKWLANGRGHSPLPPIEKQR